MPDGPIASNSRQNQSPSATSMRLETSSTKALADVHRMGHTCANLNGDLLFVWGGSDESVAYLTVKNNHLWIYDTLSGYWRHRLCAGQCPPYLSGATSALIGQRMFVFGGHSSAQDNWLNSLYCLDLETFCWQDLGLLAKAEPTKPIRSDKLVSWSYKGRFYVFGGYGWSQTEHLLELLDLQKDLQLSPDHRWPKFGWNNQLVEFNPHDNTWRWPSYSGKCPSARAAHAGALMGSTYYLFGGRDSCERLNDLYMLDMQTLTWTQIAAFSSSVSLERVPFLRHLLEPPDEDMSVEEPALVADQAALVSNDLVAPSPSSSATRAALQLQQHMADTNSEEDSEDDDDDDDDDDDHPDYQFDFSHPNHLLERWSLSSSHPSTSLTGEPADECTSSELQSRLQNCDSSSTWPIQEQQMELQQSSVSGNAGQANRDIQPADANDDSSDPLAATATEEAPKPTGRSFASFTSISEHEILLYGGINSMDENLDDCWIFDVNNKQWTLIDLKNKSPRLWHTGARTRNNEVVIIGGSCSDKIDEICTDILTISLTPKSLKRLALDAAARSIRMRTVNRAKGLPSSVSKLIRLRKQAILSARRFYTRPPAMQPIQQ